jgi:hypothetical protein
LGSHPLLWIKMREPINGSLEIPGKVMRAGETRLKFASVARPVGTGLFDTVAEFVARRKLTS